MRRALLVAARAALVRETSPPEQSLRCRPFPLVSFGCLAHAQTGARSSPCSCSRARSGTCLGPDALTESGPASSGCRSTWSSTRRPGCRRSRAQRRQTMPASDEGCQQALRLRSVCLLSVCSPDSPQAVRAVWAETLLVVDHLHGVSGVICVGHRPRITATVAGVRRMPASVLGCPPRCELLRLFLCPRASVMHAFAYTFMCEQESDVALSLCRSLPSSLSRALLLALSPSRPPALARALSASARASSSWAPDRRTSQLKTKRPAKKLPKR